jgi:hypothetical protein
MGRLSSVVVIAVAAALLGVAVQLLPAGLSRAQVPDMGVCGPNPSPPDPANPAIRVDAPVPDQVLTSPLRVSGRARVFEAVVSLALKDAGGQTIAQGTAQAAGGAPALAPFDTSLSFSVQSETPACLWVFEASARDGSPINVVQVPLTLVPASARFVESALYLGEQRPCIPASGQSVCDATRAALWNGDPDAWAARGVTDPDAVFNETVVFRVQAGDPLAIANIARILGWPYLKITSVHFAGDEAVTVTNLGGGAQDLTGWTIRSPARGTSYPLPAGISLGPGQTCTLYTGMPGASPGGGCRAFTTTSPATANADVWPDDAGEVVLFYDALNLPGDDTRYAADPAGQPPPPNLQGMTVAAGTTAERTVTLDDDGGTIQMHAGDRFLLELGSDYRWNVRVADQSVVSRVPNVTVVRGAQGIYEAHQPGQTELTATGDPECRFTQPPCGRPSRSFRVTVIVQ